MKLRVTSSPNWPLRIYFCALSVRQRRPTRLWPPTEIPRTFVIPKRKICPISTQDRVGFDGVIVWGEPRRGFGRAPRPGERFHLRPISPTHRVVVRRQCDGSNGHGGQRGARHHGGGDQNLATCWDAVHGQRISCEWARSKRGAGRYATQKAHPGLRMAAASIT